MSEAKRSATFITTFNWLRRTHFYKLAIKHLYAAIQLGI